MSKKKKSDAELFFAGANTKKNKDDPMIKYFIHSLRPVLSSLWPVAK